MKKADFSTIVGILLALILILGAISFSGSDLGDFFDLASLIIVLFGTIAVTIACFSFSEVFNSLAIIGDILFFTPISSQKTAEYMMDISEYSYKNGIMQLSKKDKLQSNIFHTGINLLIDGEKIENIQKLMTQETQALQEEYSLTISILRKAAEIAPAMGLVGTLIGLIKMLGSLNDVKMIGPAMSIALITTFYGAILAYMIFFPLASKTERSAKILLTNCDIFLLTIISIAKKENPRYLEISLNTILPAGEKINYFDQEKI